MLNTAENPRLLSSSLSCSSTDSTRPTVSTHVNPEVVQYEEDTPEERLDKLQLLMSAMRQKLSLAAFVLQQTSTAVSVPLYNLHPLQLPQGRPTFVLSVYNMSSVHCKLWLFKIGKEQGGESYVCDREKGMAELVRARALASPVWESFRYLPISGNTCPFPLHLLRYVCTTLDALCVWHHPSCLSRISNLPLDPMWQAWEDTMRWRFGMM